MNRNQLVQSGVEWIYQNDDTDIPVDAETKKAAVEYLSGLVSVALLADLAGVKSLTIARRLYELLLITGKLGG